MLKVSKIVLTALIGIFIALYFWGNTLVEVQGLTLRLSVFPALKPAAVLDLSPLGEISAQTHGIPLEIRLRLEEVSLDDVKSQWFEQDVVDTEQLLQKGRELIAAFLLQLTLVSFAGSFLLVWLLWRPRLRTALLAGGGSALLAFAVFAATVMSFNVKAFQEPHFEGPISMAPGAVRMAYDSLASLDEVKNRTNQVVGNIKALFSNIDNLTVLGDPGNNNEVKKVLLVSDLHSNPIGVEFIKTLSEHFKVDLLINAGDITDFGSPLEEEMVAGLKQLAGPMIFLPGNHDTPEINQFMAELENSYVLDGKMLEIADLKILGVPDPLSDTTEVEVEDNREQQRMLFEHQELIISAVEEQGVPDVLVVHNQEVGEGLLQEVPLVVAGHTHRIALKKDQGILINPGTAGAAGWRGLYSEKAAVYSAAILYIEPQEGPLAADIITFDPLSTRFSLDRQLLASDVADYMKKNTGFEPVQKESEMNANGRS